MLERILEDINAKKQTAQIDLDNVSRRAYPYKKGQVERAKEDLENLYIEYKNEMMKRTVFILTTGDQSSAFADLSQEFNCFTVNADDFYVDIAKKVSKDFYMNKNVNASVFDVLNNLLEDKMKQLDIISYNQIFFNSKYQRHIKTEGEFLDVVKHSITDNLGGEVVGLDALEKVCKEAVNKGYKSRVVPVVLHTKDELLISKLSNDIIKVNPRVVLLTAGETKLKDNNIIKVEKVTEESVAEALKKIAGKA